MKITVIENRRFSILGLLVALLAIVYSFPVFSQKPEIRSLDRTIGGTSDLITIKGEGFGTNAANLRVYFGAVKATIESVSGQILEVRVPSGTTYDNVSVTNITTGLTGYSREQFHLAYGGEHLFNPNNLEGQFNFDSENKLYDLCLCDFNGDGKSDVITANRGTNIISILSNNSTVNPSFSVTPYNIQNLSIHVKCGDLNGDGKPDVVFSQDGGEKVIIYKNTSTGASITFDNLNPIIITLPVTTRPKEIDIADLDLDGRPELILSNIGTNAPSASLLVLRNQSTLAAISFSALPPITIPGIPLGSSTGPLIAKDLNGDFLPEITTTLFQTDAGNKIFIIHNKSTPGNFNFETRSSLDLPGIAIADIKAGDLNGDGKPEIVATTLVYNSVLVYKNTSSNSSLSFSQPKDIVAHSNPFGIDLGDLDGDGKLDIVVASIHTPIAPQPKKHYIAILNNTTTSPSAEITFATSLKETEQLTRHINLGDLDGDGKPDIVFTSEHEVTSYYKVGVFKNKTCLVPAITPAGPLSICNGFPLRLQANTINGAVYVWRKDGLIVTGATPFLDVTLGGKYTVTVTDGSCTPKTSNEVDVTISAGALTGVPTISPAGPICVPGAVTLSISGVNGDEYKWSGPSNFSHSGATANIANFNYQNAGVYYVDIYKGSCLARRVSHRLEVVETPNFVINTGGSNVICPGDTKTISVSPTPSGFTFKWYESNNEISGATGTTYAVSSSGSYTVKATNLNCSPNPLVTSPVTIAAASQNPTSIFTAPSTTCTGSTVQFTNQSTSDPNLTTTYFWDFGDGNYSTQRDPVHTFTTASNPTYAVKLKVSYNDACTHESSKTITVSAAPAISITSLSNKICPGDSLLLGVSGPAYVNYKWNTTATSPTILAKEAGTYTVEVTTSTSCILHASKQIEAHPRPNVTVTAEPLRIPEGGSSQLTASGLINYQWTPIDGLSNTMIHNPLAQPTITTQYKVSGKDNNGCYGEAIIEVGVIGDPIVNKLGPKSFFTPNESDIINPYWSVTKIEDYPQCGVSVFDDKGVKVFEAKPYLNNWDGTFNGRRLPDGVYYYFIRCDGEENKPKAGTITLLR